MELRVAVENFIDRVAIVTREDHWEVEHSNFGNERNDRRSLAHHDSYVAFLSLSEQVSISAELSVGEIVNDESGVGGFDFVAHKFGENVSGRAFRCRVGSYEPRLIELRGCERARTQRKNEN